MATVEEIFNAADKVESKDEVSEEMNISQEINSNLTNDSFDEGDFFGGEHLKDELRLDDIKTDHSKIL